MGRGHRNWLKMEVSFACAVMERIVWNEYSTDRFEVCHKTDVLVCWCMQRKNAVRREN